MYITFSYLDKPTKAAAKSLKTRKKVGRPFGKEKYSILEANQHLQALSTALHSVNIPVGRFTIILTDSTGVIETAGTAYEFGPFDYAVESGLGASLVEIIQKDIYADTDENMSVEESYRNEKLIEQLDKALEENDSSDEVEDSDVQPWEIAEDSGSQEESLDQEILAERLAEEKLEQEEENKTLELVEEDEPVTYKLQVTETKTFQELEHSFDYEEYISPILESSELFTDQDKKIEEITSLHSLLSGLPEEEPWLNEKIRQYIQNEHAQSDILNLKQVFNRTRQEALSKTRSLLAEQYRNVQEDKVEERAYSQLTPSIKALENQIAEDIQQYVGSLEEKWLTKEQELKEKESQEIERVSKEIQTKYNRLKNKELEEKEELITKFTAEEEERLIEEQKKLLEQEKTEIIKEHDATLTQVRIEAKKETEDHLKKVFTNAIQVIQDKNKAILAAVNDQVEIWKDEHQKDLLAKEAAAEKERKEAIKQQRIQLQKEKQALRKKELQLKEMELGKEKASPLQNQTPNQTQPLVVAYPPMNNDQSNAQTEQLIVELRNEVNQLKQKNSGAKEALPTYKQKFSRLFISGIVLGSLALGGVSTGLYNYFSDSDAKADVQTTVSLPSETTSTSFSQGKTSKEYPATIDEKLDRDTIREFLFEAGNKDQLESFNNAYPSAIGDMEIAILNNHAVNAIKAYEKLSGADKEKLGQAQKVAVRAYYTANNEVSKAEEVK